MAEPGTYLYAVARRLPAGALADAHGLRGRPLQVVAEADLQAVASEVDLREFGEEGLRQHLEDLAWLEEVARTHDRVIRTVAHHAEVAPMRLATVFLHEDSVRDRLRGWAPALNAALDRVKGCSEWSVKGYVDTSGSTPEEPTATGGEQGSGTAYLLKRRSQLAAQERAQQEAARAGDSVHHALVEGVAASRRLPAQDRRLTGHEGTMVLNAAYLVGDAASDAWRARVDRAVQEHPDVRVELDGPWPPYSFATLEDAP